jgi:hypothetical protein
MQCSYASGPSLNVCRRYFRLREEQGILDGVLR